MTLVYTTGVFDILHPGHISTLKRAREYGDKLIVGVQDDESVEKQKGRRPTLTCKERMMMLEELPFVDSCISYFNIDQREMMEKIRPNVFVQTEEWTVQTDRSVIIDYLNQKKIKLILLPIQKNISSTQIKQRIIENSKVFRNDIEFLYSALQIVPIEELLVYENYDPQRARRLYDKISNEKLFLNPITVAVSEGVKIVIDGANRLEALKEMGARYALVRLVDYNDEEQVSLNSNAHFLNYHPDLLFSQAKESGFGLVKLSGAGSASDSNNFPIIICVNNEDYYGVIDHLNRKGPVKYLNDFVDLYLGKCEIYRLSELSQDKRWFPIKVIFKKLIKREIVDLAKQGELLNSGITWHKTTREIVRFCLPLEYLLVEEVLEDKKKKLLREIESKLTNKDIRYYPSNIYFCDEWGKK
jgi:rfaE bifunctional protein nucleotidyltransferase chain/domain